MLVSKEESLEWAGGLRAQGTPEDWKTLERSKTSCPEGWGALGGGRQRNGLVRPGPWRDGCEEPGAQGAEAAGSRPAGREGGTSEATVRSPRCGARSLGQTALTRGAEQGPTGLQEGGGKLHGRLGSVGAPRTKVALPRAWPWASCTPSSPLFRTRASLPPLEKCTVCSDNRQSPGQLPAQASGSEETWTPTPVQVSGASWQGLLGQRAGPSYKCRSRGCASSTQGSPRPSPFWRAL